MKDNGILGVALTKEACPLCGKLENGALLMNTRLNKSQADKVNKLHGKVIGYMKKPCNECNEIMSKAILIVGCVEAKTDDRSNPYRSGNIWGITEEAVRKIFSSEKAEEVIKKRTCFLSVEAAYKLGFPDCNLNA
jgi:hypothetical protein